MIIHFQHYHITIKLLTGYSVVVSQNSWHYSVRSLTLYNIDLRFLP